MPEKGDAVTEETQLTGVTAVSGVVPDGATADGAAPDGAKQDVVMENGGDAEANGLHKEQPRSRSNSRTRDIVN